MLRLHHGSVGVNKPLLSARPHCWQMSSDLSSQSINQCTEGVALRLAFAPLYLAIIPPGQHGFRHSGGCVRGEMLLLL